MIIKPKARGFISTTAHPTGCYKNVETDSNYVLNNWQGHAPKRVVVIGSSTGYGLASRLVAAFGPQASTIGVFFEREGSDKRTATAGHYNNAAFEELAKNTKGKHISLNGDAFSQEMKTKVIDEIKANFEDGQVDLIIYSLASPKRTDHDGVTYKSVIKPIGGTYKSKTVDFHTGEVTEVEVEPATEEEIQQTVKVMGGEDWKLWIEEMNNAGVIANNAVTVAFSYIGPELTHAVYKDGTIGMAKIDLEEKAREITDMLKPLHGQAYVSVNKALVTQASSAIPVVPLYISILYKIMKENGTHEGTIEQAMRLFKTLYGGDIPLDESGRIRIDDLEMQPEIQQAVNELWPAINTENVYSLSDLKGYSEEFYSLFGFGIDGVDYDADVEV